MCLSLLLPCPCADLIEALQHPQILHKPSTSSQKRKRGQEEQDAGHRSPPTQDQLPSKRPRIKLSSSVAERESHPEAATDVSENCLEPLPHWIQTGRWRKDYFEQDSQVREDFERGKSPEKSNKRDWLRDFYAKELIRSMHGFPHLPHLFARKRSASLLSRKSSQSTLETSSDQLSRGAKSVQYRYPEYEIRLERKGSYMDESTLGITDTSRDLCRSLLGKEQTVPQDTLFRDDLFDETCKSVRGRNEATVIRDISPLICPSAQVLRIFGAIHLNNLCEGVNEGWNSAEEFEGTRPQPDYSVGFRLSAFTEEQLNKLKPFVGEPGFKLCTHFMATTRMYFPFLTCEVKCGAASLDVADRQNAHSMTIAVRALVELFRLVKREKELDREILAFSISHDHSSVRIYGHYSVIEGDKTTFYRHPIHSFNFTALDGKEKWTAYKFVKNVYDHHSRKLHTIICSGIDDLPADIPYDLSQSASFSQSTPQRLRQSNAESMLSEVDSQSSFLGSQEVTATTSFTQTTERASKKPRNQRAADQ